MNSTRLHYDWWRGHNSTIFSRKLRILKNQEQYTKKSRIHDLNPFLDELGCLRVGGRLKNSRIACKQKHPIIISPENSFTKLIIKHEHDKLMHACCQTVITSLRTRYCSISVKGTVKRVLKNCIRCFRANPITSEYIMGNLPSARVNPASDLYACGVDFAGPFLLKDKLRSRTFTKAYICIFVCFAVKAVHIELAVVSVQKPFWNVSVGLFQEEICVVTFILITALIL